MLPIENRRQVGAGGLERRSKFQRTAQEILAVMEPANARRQFGQHPDGAVIIWIALQSIFQQRLGFMKLVGKERMTSAQKYRIGRSGLDRPLLEFRSFLGFAGCSQRQTDQPQGRG